MKVWILQTGEPLPIDDNGLRPMRAMNLTKALIEHGHEVILWSSNFDHFSKSHRFSNRKDIQFSDSLSIKLIHSRGYKSHFGIARLFDHLQLGWNLARMLHKESPPDVAFIGYPPIETAWVMATWLKRKKIPSVVDVKDAWPKILLRGFPPQLHPLLRILLIPYFLMMRKTFNSVTSISSVTREFLTWCEDQSSRDSSRNSMNIVNYLTSNNENSESNLTSQQLSFLHSNQLDKQVIMRGVFVGTLNSAFDFNPLLSAAKDLPIEIVIAGDGPVFDELKQKSSHLKNFRMLGWVKESEARALYKISDFMFAPYKDLPDFDIHIPNKIFDAMSNALPLVSSITGTTRNLIIEKEIGVVYDCDSATSLTNELQKLISHREGLGKMGENSKQLYDQVYSFKEVYGNCVRHLEELYRQNSR